MSRINHQPIFLLTSTPWRENSLRVEAFSRDFGRVSLLARSARSKGSDLRGVLLPFVPISASWFGKEELKTLHRAQWLGGWRQPEQKSLFSALYLNELLLKLLPNSDPHPNIFSALSDAMREICTRNDDAADALRRFEWTLLTELGVAPNWQQDHVGNPIEKEAIYLIQPEQSARAIVAATVKKLPPNSVAVSGQLLHQIGSGQLNPQSDLTAALQLTRLLLRHQLPQDVNSRRVLQQLQALKARFK